MEKISVDTLQRIRKIEVITDKLRSELDDVLKAAYEKAVEAEDVDGAADIARKIRDKMLAETDNKCALDRVLPEAPESTIFSGWITWLRSLAQVRSNAWGIYRQALRDITDQPGFPLNIEWPQSPGDSDE